MRSLSRSKLNKNKSLLRLHDNLSCDMMFDNSISDLSENEHMREFKKDVEKRIIEEVHPYRIYESGTRPGIWYTHLPDETKPEKRRKIMRQSYEDICKAVIEFYHDQYHLGITLEELFDDWARFRRDETAVKDGTIRKDVGLWRKYIKDAIVGKKKLGKMKVTEVTPKLLYQYFRKLTKDREYTRHSVNNIRGVFSGMLGYAVEREIIDSNPTHSVDLKRLAYKPEQTKQDDVFTLEEAQKLLHHLAPIEDDPYALAIRLDFNMFIRVGEIAGLKWENIDLEKRTAYICKQITYEPVLKDDMTFSKKQMVTEDYLKGCTAQGYRTEHLTNETIDILKKAKALNPDGEYVFMPNGRPIITLTFNKRLKRYCEAAGVPYHSSHKIRFYACSAAYNGENLAQVSKMMGHSQISTTLHYLRDVKQDADYSGLFEKLGTQSNG